MRRYPGYKDSGVEWLGEVPEGWEVRRFKTILREREERSADGSETLLSVSAYTGVTPRSENIDEGDFISRAESLEGYKVCYQGDLVMNIMLAWNRAQGVSAHGGIVSPAYAVFELTTAVHPAYLNYLVRSNEYCLYFKAHSAGVIDSRLRLYPEQFGALHSIFPPLPEQTAIAAFLDRETVKIDALVAEQRRLIDLLREKRQAVISHAVTKGLNPNTPLKPSGIDWLGDVPEGWEVKALKRAVTFQRGHDLPSDSRVEGLIPVVSSGGVIGFHDQPITNKPTIVTGRYGTIGNFQLVQEPCWPLNTALYSTDIYGNNAVFILYMLQAYCDHFILNSSKSAVPGVDRNDIHSVSITLPPLEEQCKLAEFLENMSVKLGTLTATAETAIALLQERRAALISAAVTGKIDVRNLVQKETEAA